MPVCTFTGAYYLCLCVYVRWCLLSMPVCIRSLVSTIYGITCYSPIHIIFERLEAVTILNAWRVIRCNTTCLKPVTLSDHTCTPTCNQTRTQSVSPSWQPSYRTSSCQAVRLVALYVERQLVPFWMILRAAANSWKTKLQLA